MEKPRREIAPRRVVCRGHCPRRLFRYNYSAQRERYLLFLLPPLRLLLPAASHIFLSSLSSNPPPLASLTTLITNHRLLVASACVFFFELSPSTTANLIDSCLEQRLLVKARASSYVSVSTSHFNRALLAKDI